MATDEQRKYYINKICSICVNRNNCDKTKFICVEVYDKTSMKCLQYECDKKD